MTTRLSPARIRAEQLDNPKMRARDLAGQLGISEAALVAAGCGAGTVRLDAPMPTIFPLLESLGEVMALTRNESAVHEKIGVYDNFIAGKHASMMLGAEIDMRMFPGHWAHAFSVETTTAEGETRRSLQFFDKAGDALHKIHLRAASSDEAWAGITRSLAHTDQSCEFEAEIIAAPAAAENDDNVPLDDLRRRWQSMTDTHQFVSILKVLKLSRLRALESIGPEFAERILAGSVATMMLAAADAAVPIMVFVGNRGCIQIHSGPIKSIRSMGPWLNVMDADFHLHLRTDRIAGAWLVRKPTDKGYVTSLEAYDQAGELIIQFFGKRIEGQDERTEWRTVMESLPRLELAGAA
ncbi:putative hemin transport protein [Hoeflea marina]|uniref:Putative hemin transport protein n=1 Tax=Hoeflea marina TaxID=274592 RepID=A0A317PQS9_9HYPH|nr:ChuX/HutX family heme-like substrate-binding protein [Hoeflea marina]PWW03848.1 putative hemin transport protein [Hoeflea marina]